MTTLTTPKTAAPAAEQVQAKVATGVAAAAMVSSGIGALFLGLMTTGAVISAGLKSALNLWNPAGPLSGKTTVAVLAWLVSWYLLNRVWHAENRDLKQAFTITLVLVAIGVLLTFPPIFDAFH